MKTCSRCKTEKPLADFNKGSSSKDGYQRWCRVCCKESNAENYLNGNRAVAVRAANDKAIERNLAYLKEYLLSHPCVDCGETDIVVLEFDHLHDKVKEVTSMAYMGLSLAKIQAEIDKCEVRCANDHRRITVKRRKEKNLMLL